MNDVQREMFSIMDKFRRLDFQSKILDIPKGEFRVLAVIMMLSGKFKDSCNGSVQCKGHPHFVAKLSNTDEITVGDISNALNISKPQLSKLLNQTDEKGYTTRSVSKKDKRVTYVTITDFGIDKVQNQMKKMEEFSNNAMERFGEENSKEMLRLFNKLYLIFEEEIKENIEKRGKADD